jgi:hypothetical protein
MRKLLPEESETYKYVAGMILGAIIGLLVYSIVDLLTHPLK